MSSVLGCGEGALLVSCPALCWRDGCLCTLPLCDTLFMRDEASKGNERRRALRRQRETELLTQRDLWQYLQLTAFNRHWHLLSHFDIGTQQIAAEVRASVERNPKSSELGQDWEDFCQQEFLVFCCCCQAVSWLIGNDRSSLAAGEDWTDPAWVPPTQWPSAASSQYFLLNSQNTPDVSARADGEWDPPRPPPPCKMKY